jgi:eukaryotic-like serine/threonine-protein kinase
VLFEMCARQPPFTGSTVSETLQAVIEREPDWAALPAGTPPTLLHLMRRCLTKDSRLRLRDIGEARIALSTSDADDMKTPIPQRRTAIVAGAGVLGLALLFALTFYRPGTVARTLAPVRFLLPPPEGGQFPLHPGGIQFAISPDASQLAFVASDGTGARERIWLRPLEHLEARPLPGTEAAVNPFWSPDGRSLAFFTESKLKRIDLPAGVPVTVCDLPGAVFSHGTWGHDVMLIGRGDGTDVKSVPAAGGTPRTVLTRDPARHELRVHWPWFLPGGKRFLYIARLDDGGGELRIGQLADSRTERAGLLDGTPRSLMPVISNVQWINPDIVMFVREGVLMGQRVDLDRARPVGAPFTVANEVDYFYTTSRGMFSVSPTGALAYHSGGNLQQLVWVDRKGVQLETVGDPADYSSAQLSRDGTKLLVARGQPGLGTDDIWTFDLVRKTQERLTTSPDSDMSPVWIEDERAIAYASDGHGSVPHLFRMDLATRTSTELQAAGTQQHPKAVLPGGRGIAFTWVTPSGGFSLFEKRLDPRAAPTPLIDSDLNVFDMRLSPDGRLMAYIAEGDGRSGVYVARMPPTSAPELVAEKVSPPRWSADGRELYFVRDDRLMSIPVRSGADRLEIGIPQPLFTLTPGASLMLASREGRFLLSVPRVVFGERPIVVSTTGVGSPLP